MNYFDLTRNHCPVEEDYTMPDVKHIYHSAFLAYLATADYCDMVSQSLEVFKVYQTIAEDFYPLSILLDRHAAVTLPEMLVAERS